MTLARRNPFRASSFAAERLVDAASRKAREAATARGVKHVTELPWIPKDGLNRSWAAVELYRAWVFGDLDRLPPDVRSALTMFGARLPEPPPLHVLAATRSWPRRDRPGWPTIEDVLAPLRAGRIDEARRPAPPPYVTNEIERMRRMRKKLPNMDWGR